MYTQYHLNQYLSMSGLIISVNLCGFMYSHSSDYSFILTKARSYIIVVERPLSGFVADCPHFGKEFPAV